MTRAPSNPLRRSALALVLATLVVAAGCSSSDSGGDAPATTDSVSSTTAAGSPTTAAGGTDGGDVTASAELCVALNDQLNSQDAIIDSTATSDVESLAATARDANDALAAVDAGDVADQVALLTDATDTLLDELADADFETAAVAADLQTTMTDPDYIAALQALSRACAAQ